MVREDFELEFIPNSDIVLIHQNFCLRVNVGADPERSVTWTITKLDFVTKKKPPELPLFLSFSFSLECSAEVEMLSLRM